MSVPRVSVRREKKSSWLRLYQSYISNWYVNGKLFTSTTAWKPKKSVYFFLSSKLNSTCILTCAEAEINIQVGLNMHLYVDIGDASSSLWGSTSSYVLEQAPALYLKNWKILVLFKIVFFEKMKIKIKLGRKSKNCQEENVLRIHFYICILSFIKIGPIIKNLHHTVFGSNQVDR